MEKNKVVSLVVNSIKDNVDLINEQRENLEQDPNSFRILGEHENIDSLDLVSILADIESNLFKETNFSIILSSDKAMSHTNSPFRDVESLSNFILEELKSKENE